MTDFATLAERYIAMWNETDAATRRTLVSELWADQARYVDPLADVRGHAEIDATIAAVQAQFPGWSFRLAGPVDAHHDQARFSWELGPSGVPAPVVGFDVAQLNEAGQLALVLGFLDRVPS
jgi:hypothetical protein